MTLHLLRALFFLLMGSIGWAYLNKPGPGPFGAENALATFAVAIALAILVLAIDIFSSRRKLLSLSAILFGTLVGMVLAYVLGFAAVWLVDQFVPPPPETSVQFRLPTATTSPANGAIPPETSVQFRLPTGEMTPVQFRLPTGELTVRDTLISYFKMLLNIVCCYLMISFIFQTKDDIRFIIPYVMFARQTRGQRPLLLDTNVLIDGRIADIADVGLIDSRLVVPRVVLDELQALADSSDKLRRNRGRRGLDIVARLQSNRKVEVVIYAGTPSEGEDAPVDQQLLMLAAEMNGRVLTTDFNLNKVAQLRGTDVVNINDLASAMKPVVLPGEKITISLIKPGEQPGQAVGYLDDGTMVVVEQARQHIGEEIEATVTSMVQTSAGRMIFSRLAGPSTAGRGQSARRSQIPAEKPTPTP